MLVGHYGGKALYFTVSVIAMYIEHNHLNAPISVIPHYPVRGRWGFYEVLNEEPL